MAAPSETAQAAPSGDDTSWRSPAVLAHVVPFVAWVGLRLLFDQIAPGQAWPYAVQTAVSGLLLVGLRPWRYYPKPSPRHLPLALLGGILVLVAWVGPFCGMGEGMPWLQELYLRFCVLPLGRLPTLPATSPYAPDVCGWPLTLARIGGSAFVIAVAEEFFWRGFLYRRLVQVDFLRLPLGAYDREAFWLSALLFGLEHRELAAGMAAGLVYGAIMLRTRGIWAAIVAHSLTNLLLGIYVIHARAYGFW